MASRNPFGFRKSWAICSLAVRLILAPKLIVDNHVAIMELAGGTNSIPERANPRRAVPSGLPEGRASAIGAMMPFWPMEVAMIRFLGGRSLAVPVLVLGLGVFGCNEAKSPPSNPGKQDASKAQEQMEKQKELMMKMRDQNKDKSGGTESSDKDKDKDKPKEDEKDKQ
jgi:hypothetical protein